MGWGVTSTGGDPNWLLSTDAQVNAALVAFIGGLLVARLASLARDRAVATGQREAAGGVLREAQAAERLEVEECRRLARRRLVSELLPELVATRGGGALRPEVLMQGKRWDSEDGSADELVLAAKRKVRGAFDEVGRGLRERGAKANWDEARAAYQLPVDRDDQMVYERVYLSLVAQQEERARLSLSRAREGLRVQAASVVRDLRAGGDPGALAQAEARLLALDRPSGGPRRALPVSVYAYGPEDRARTDAATQELARRRLATTAAGQALAAAEAAEVRAASPPNTRAALLSLVWLAVTGLALPLAVLAETPLTLSVWLRVVVVLLPVVGLGFLFVALVRGLVPGGFAVLVRGQRKRRSGSPPAATE